MPNVKNQQDNQIAWAAGLFEGEGCITASADGNHGYTLVRIMLGSTDRDIVERFMGVVGYGHIYTRKKNNDAHRDFFAWSASGTVTKPTLEAFLPYFGDRRAEKARFAIELLNSLKPGASRRTHCPYGHEYTEENTYRLRNKRYCRSCRPAYQLKYNPPKRLIRA